ncbi:MAG: hypothetical protein WBD99_07615 [Thermodesulfobacteriota bacterium]
MRNSPLTPLYKRGAAKLQRPFPERAFMGGLIWESVPTSFAKASLLTFDYPTSKTLAGYPCAEDRYSWATPVKWTITPLGRARVPSTKLRAGLPVTSNNLLIA